MPRGTNNYRPERIRALAIGHPGSGKSSSLAALADEGYRVIIADFDNGIDNTILHAKKHPENIYYEQFNDPIGLSETGFAFADGHQLAWPRFQSWLRDWRYTENGEEKTLGPVSQLGPKDIFVIDTLGSLAESIMNHRLNIANKSLSGAAQDKFNEYTPTYSEILNLIEAISNPARKHHFLVLSHIDYRDFNPVNDTNFTTQELRKDRDKNVRAEVVDIPIYKGNPLAIGKLSSRIAGKFNAMFYFATEERNNRTTYVVHTRPADHIDVKHSSPTPLDPKIPTDKFWPSYFGASAPKQEIKEEKQKEPTVPTAPKREDPTSNEGSAK
jgi:hypothetical protein